MSAKNDPKIPIPANAQKRVIIRSISPSVACCNQYSARSTRGEPIDFKAIIIADGHDKIFARLLIKQQKTWKDIELLEESNDNWTATYIPDTTGILEFKIQAWISDLKSWQDSYERKEVESVATTLDKLRGTEIYALEHNPKNLQQQHSSIVPSVLKPEVYASLLRSIAKDQLTSTELFTIDVEREKARFSTWYELFPRSCGTEEGRHGTFLDVISKLPSLKEAGFDVLYLPPIHPIGSLNRKGKNNNLVAMPEEPGSPWAIGNSDGGHKSIHPELGSMQDFKNLIQEAEQNGIEIAMDIAFQCSPDHPYVKDHPEWFKWRPDGTVQFAENPPKKYEDILPFDFDTEAWESLWTELLSIFTFWIDKGIHVFRVDNPHTKPLRLWQWLISTIRATNPEIIFLAEAFTRPSIMEQLAMTGFTQSYTYFTWRTSKKELQDYLTELTTTSMKYFFRPNFWPNTPDILPEHLVTGGENMHVIRLLLAATLSSNYGIYGPVFERNIHEPMPGKEEYIDNEKYEIKYWAPIEESRIWKTIKKVNRIRKEFFALQVTNNVNFLETSNEQIMAYLKLDKVYHRHLLIVLNLDSRNTQSAWINIPLEKWTPILGTTWELADQLNEETYNWAQEWNYVELHPDHKPAHIFTIVNSNV